MAEIAHQANGAGQVVIVASILRAKINTGESKNRAAGQPWTAIVNLPFKRPGHDLIEHGFKSAAPVGKADQRSAQLFIPHGKFHVWTVLA